MVCDQHRVERLPVNTDPIGNDADRLYRRGVQAGEVSEQPVLMEREMLQHFLQCVDVVAHSDEPHYMSGNASGKSDEHVLGPFGQGRHPGQCDQPGVRLGGGKPRHLPIFAAPVKLALGRLQPKGLGPRDFAGAQWSTA